MTESIEKKLLRQNPPRVKITYDVHTGGAIEKRELPFKVLHVSKQMASHDFGLVKELEDASYGTYGGYPYSLLVADFEIRHGAQDARLLTSIAHIAAAAHAPFIVASNAPTAALKAFKELEDSRYVVITPSIDNAKLLAQRIEESYLQNGWLGQFEDSSAFFHYPFLPYLLAASRFAHYVKVIVRDKVGGFMTRGNVEAYLNSWISQYVLLDDNAPEEAKAFCPLRDANIVVTEITGSPGAYLATLFIKPHFQMQELTTSIRLVANLPA
jgi:predicted component of type VI protein secretion system